MDIHQLRSWIFELYEPLENERQYLVFDRERGNLLVDVPRYSDRAVRLLKGLGGVSLLFVTNARRAADAHRYREALGCAVAAHADDSAAVEGGASITVGDGELLRPDMRVVRVGEDGDGASVLLARKAGGILISGDLDLRTKAATRLMSLEFAAILSAQRPPTWDAGKEQLLEQQKELPKTRKQFGILLPPPWDREYAGRLQDKMYDNPLIPKEETAARESAMGSETLVVARAARETAARPRRPTWDQPSPPAGGAAPGGGDGARKRPRPFEEDWNAPATPAPPTTIANAPRDITPELRPRPAGERFRRISVEELFAVAGVDGSGGIDLSPDGAEVAFAWDRTGNAEIFVAPLVGDRIYQLTESDAPARSPRWSPDGTRIAFVRDGAIHLVDRDGNNERALTAAGDRSDIDWSPDGTRIAFVSGGALRVIDVAAGQETELADASLAASAPRWSPDGTRLVFTSGFDADVPKGGDLYVVPASGGGALRLETRDGAAGESFGAEWSPDGDQVAFTTRRGAYEEIAVADVDAAGADRVEHPVRSNFDDRAPVWQPDRRALLYLRSQDAAVSVRRVFVVSRADHAAFDVPGVHSSVRIAADSETVAFVLNEPRRGADVWARTAGTIEPRPVTRSLPASIDPLALVEPVHVRYPGADGTPIPALVYVPHVEAVTGADAPPAIVYLHGAPSQHARAFDPGAQALANAGYVVFAPNQRGSQGYGREFRDANGHDWGGKDLEDVIRGVEWLAQQGIADAGRVGVMGGSYGGYLALMALATAPERFRAGVAQWAFISLQGLWERSNARGRDLLTRELGDPSENAQLYHDRSAAMHIDRITAPLLVMYTENDPVVPRDQSDALVAALRKTRKPYEQHVYAGATHGVVTREARLDAFRRAMEWFETHVR